MDREVRLALTAMQITGQGSWAGADCDTNNCGQRSQAGADCDTNNSGYGRYAGADCAAMQIALDRESTLALTARRCK